MSRLDRPIPVTVLTGFLGSGKTTLLGKLLGQPEMAGTAVIINEFGEVGLDDLLVSRADEPVLLKNGCLCCTVRGDLALALQDLLLKRMRQDYAFERVMIETTGLADPAPIIQTLVTDPGIAGRFRLDGVVTIVDCAVGLDTLDRFPESVKQAAIADRLLLSKQDIASPEDVVGLRTRLGALNPGAILVNAAHGDVAAAELLGLGLYDPESRDLDVERWLRADAYDTPHGHDDCAGAGCNHASHHKALSHRHIDRIRSCCLIRDRPIRWAEFSGWIDALIRTRSSELLRVKGIVDILECPGEPLVIHGVQQVFHPPVRMENWPSDDHRTRIVLIVRDWDDRDIAAMFARLP
ncbi:CobW family GTP-binding protein [Bradyrhizobium sp.]|uniref:CobW family GTP-binding protein n=1 Tax=Bradyrhizobium sp. TaxID=376 RepID=UPI0039E55363